MRRSCGLGLAGVILLGSLVAGCRGSSADAEQASDLTAEAPEPVRPPFAIREDSTNLLFVYRETSGALRTVTKLADVPAERRAAVRVDSLSIAPERRLDPRYVYVADLRSRGADGYRVVKMLREQFEAGFALDGAPPSPVAVAGREPRGDGAQAPRGDAQVTIYGTSWCGACRQAARWLTSRGIPFVERDIERDAQARAEMESRAALQGFVPRGVPVIDVRGTLIDGFNPARIEQLLASRAAPAPSLPGPAPVAPAPPVPPPVTGPVRPI